MSLLIHAKPRRQQGKQSGKLRAQGILPVVLYGHNVKPKNLGILFGEFEQVWRETGRTTLIDLAIEDAEPTKVLIHDVQYHPLTDRVIHADLYQVKLTEKIKVTIPIQTVGEAPAIKELQGTLITNKNEVEVEALPQNLVQTIEVDVSNLKTFTDAIQIKDLIVPSGVEILDDPEEVVVLVQPPRSEEELAELEEKPVEDVEAVAVEEKGKEEETAEGQKILAEGNGS